MCSKGGVAEFQPGDGHMRDGYYGWVDFYFSMVWWYLWWCSNRWVGYGGSVFQWHPKLNIGFAFTPTLLEYHCFFNKKAARMQVGRRWTNRIYQIYKHLPNNSGRGCALRRETGSCKERPVDESQRTWNQCEPFFLIMTWINIWKLLWSTNKV